MLTGDLAALQADVGPSYQLEREIGSGGMATVYLAHDVKHDRPVALKVLRRELAAHLGADRFRREIKLVANLQHPRILTVLDSGQTRSGLLWFTMPFIDGETLRARLRHNRPLPIDETIRITRDIADALQYAHDRGIIHRDVKPENVLLSGGHALLADFGIARPIAPTPRSEVTDPGFAVGTFAYASPEQAAALPVDGRADVYSLGAVCYEMLTGEQPYPGSSGLVAFAQQITTSGPLVRPRRPDVPIALERAVRKALASDPEKRFASPREFAAALDARPIPRAPHIRRMIAGSLAAVFVLSAVAVTLALRARHGPNQQSTRVSPRADGTPTIAVLPFDNIGDTSTAYFADGVSDEVRGKLASLRDLRVIATTSSLQYRHSNKLPEQVARELGARYLLTGRVRWEALPDGQRRVRVEPELVEVGDTATVPTTRWHQSFDADVSDVFRVQTAIADQVTAALNLALGAVQRERLSARPTASLAAYDAYLRGEAVTGAMSTADPASLRRGAAFYARAVSIDSTFALAWARVAYVHAELFFNTGPSPGDEASAQSALRKVQHLAPGRPETQLALAWALLVHRDYRGSLDAAQVGLGTAPNDVELLAVAGLAQRSLGQWEQALASFVAAEALDPRSVIAATEWGRTLHVLRRLPEARSAFEHALALAPGNVYTVENLAMLSLSQGDLSDARLVVHTALATVDTTALVAFFAAYYDLYWALADPEQLRVLELTPSDFDGDRGIWDVTRAEVAWLRSDTTAARRYATAAELEYARLLRATPNDDQRRLYHALSLAYLGRKRAAIAEAERGVALRPVSEDAFNGPVSEQIAARVDLIAGEPERALDRLEHLLSIPTFLTPAWLAIDPTWASLRSNARFAYLLAYGPPRVESHSRP